MSEAKHTPGPWKMETVPTQIGVCHKIGSFPGKGKRDNYACIYDDCSHPRAQDEELLANARLIAAAPEMLEALKAMVTDEAFEELCQGVGEEPAWLNMARAAIAKAEVGDE